MVLAITRSVVETDLTLSSLVFPILSSYLRLTTVLVGARLRLAAVGHVTLDVHRPRTRHGIVDASITLHSLLHRFAPRQCSCKHGTVLTRASVLAGMRQQAVKVRAALISLVSFRVICLFFLVVQCCTLCQHCRSS